MTAMNPVGLSRTSRVTDMNPGVLSLLRNRQGLWRYEFDVLYSILQFFISILYIYIIYILYII